MCKILCESHFTYFIKSDPCDLDLLHSEHKISSGHFPAKVKKHMEYKSLVISISYDIERKQFLQVTIVTLTLEQMNKHFVVVMPFPR